MRTNLVRLEFALTLGAWFFEILYTKTLLAFLNKVEDFYVTVNVLDAYVFVSLIAHFDGNILAA